MKDRLIIIGASGHGKVVADIAVKMNMWKKIVFIDDNLNIEFPFGFEVIGGIDEAIKYKENSDFFVAIGDNLIRENIQKKLEREYLNIISLVHPDAVIGMNVKIGNGTVVMAGVVINPSTQIGEGCIINTNASLDHDNLIEDYVHISPAVHLAGTVVIGKRTWLGIGCVVRNNIMIHRDCMIGAGSVVVNDIDISGTYVGVPARRVVATYE